MFIGPCIIATVDEWKTNLMSLAVLFHLLCAQHVSGINISIFRSSRLCWWITTSVILFSVRCVLELLVRLVFGGVRFAGFSLQNELLKMDILMSETCWAHNKWNKTASDIKLVFHSSTITELKLYELWKVGKCPPSESVQAREHFVTESRNFRRPRDSWKWFNRHKSALVKCLHLKLKLNTLGSLSVPTRRNL